jgi:Lon-like ATP-dependent protease
MQESIQIAHSFSKVFTSQYLKNDFLVKNDIHLHAPEGAIPKDGPSAGITITSCLVSLALQRSVKQNIAMTGEISLRGKILKIGGVKEKVLAAQRESVKELIFPKDNEDDVRELKSEVTEGI